MREISCVAVHGDAKHTAFMQAADVFEPFKVLASATRYTLTLKAGCSDQKAVADLKRLLEADNQRVVAVFIPGSSEGAYRDESVRVVSDGRFFRTLDDILESFFYKEGSSVVKSGNYREESIN